MGKDQDHPDKDAGTRNEDDADADGEKEFSPSSQIGREQAGGSHVTRQEPGAKSNEGWPMPDQSDTPPEWPVPTID